MHAAHTTDRSATALSVRNVCGSPAAERAAARMHVFKHGDLLGKRQPLESSLLPQPRATLNKWHGVHSEAAGHALCIALKCLDAVACMHACLEPGSPHRGSCEHVAHSWHDWWKASSNTRLTCCATRGVAWRGRSAWSRGIQKQCQPHHCGQSRAAALLVVLAEQRQQREGDGMCVEVRAAYAPVCQKAHSPGPRS